MVWHIFRTLSIIVNSDIFRHIHVLLRHIQLYYGIFRTLLHSESWQIYNLRYNQTSVKTYSGIFRTLCIESPANFGIFRTLGIFRIRHTFRYIQVYSIMIVFLFSSINHIFWHFSRRATCEICSKLTKKTPEYVKLTIKMEIKTPLTSFWPLYC